MSDPKSPGDDIFASIGVTPQQLYQNLVDLYPILSSKGGDGPPWIFDAMAICRTAAEEVYRHLHPEIAGKEYETARAQDEATRRYLADESQLAQLDIPIEAGALYYLRTKRGLEYKRIKNLLPVLRALKFEEMIHPADPINIVTGKGKFQERPAWISTLALDLFAQEKAKQQRQRRAKEKPRKG